jgi:Gas vesicle synthesis protein GvpL/GvpF
MSDADGTWVYAVVSPDDAGALAAIQPDGIRGVVGEPVRTLNGAMATAIVGTVDLNQFGEEPLRQRLADLAWLETAARAHHQVIAAAAESGPTLPWRFATVYQGDERVTELLEQRGPQFAATLRRLAGRSEWGVKGYLVDQPSPPVAPPPAAGSPGTAYLMQRRTLLLGQEDHQRRVQRDADEIYAALSRLADSALLYAAQDQRLSNRSEMMVLNAACLIPRAHAEGFEAAVTDLADRYPGVRLEVTGPWPPYSFVEPDRPAGAREAAS